MSFTTGIQVGDISPTRHNSGEIVNMWGFGPKNRNPDNINAHKIEIDSIAANTLFCQALCIRDSSGASILMIALDLGSISLETVQEIKDRLIIASGNELKYDSICINISHTHGAPTMESMPGWQDGVNTANPSYVEYVIEQVSKIGTKAFQEKGTTVNIFTHTGKSGIAHHRKRSVRDLHDPTLSILSIQDAVHGSVLGIIGSTACHPVSMRRELNADFVGVFRESIQKIYPGAFSMFLQGFAATSNPHPDLGNYQGLENQRNYMQIIGETLAREVSGILTLSRNTNAIQGNIHTGATNFSFALDNNISSLDPNNPELGNIPYRGWYAAKNTLRTQLEGTQQLLRLGFLENGNPVSIGTSSHEVDGSIGKTARDILGKDSMMLAFSNGVQGYMVRPESPDDMVFPIRNDSPLNYESSHSHVWYGNIGPLIQGWYYAFIENFRELLKNSNK